MNTTTIEITLELEHDGDTVAGHARATNGEVREFSGRIGLMALIDSLLDEASTDGLATALNMDGETNAGS